LIVGAPLAERTLLVRYQGSVQGVGFRATVRRIAQGHPVRGWVKNEADGSVSLIATAESAALDVFLHAIRKSRLGGMIDREVVESAAPVEGAGFGIRH
jgi:acylphosphatase